MYEFLYRRLMIPNFFTSQWLHVKKFQEALDDMRNSGCDITAETVLPAMSAIIKNANGQETIDGISTNTLAKGARLLAQSIQSSEMDEDWFIKKFGQIYERVISLRNNEDYVVNPIQMDKFLDLVSYFMKRASEYEDDFVEIEKAEMKQGFGGVTATFLVFSLSGIEEVKEFCKVLKNCSAVSVDVVEGSMVCISCTVHDIFVQKQ